MKRYIQCELKRALEFEVAWIPEEFATLGRVLRIKKGNWWEDGWKVVQKYGAQTREMIDEFDSQHRNFSAVMD